MTREPTQLASRISRRASRLDTCRYGNTLVRVARASTTSDVFNAVADVHRRDILDVLIAGEKAVGAIVSDLSMSQPQVSKHLRVLSEVGLVRCRSEGRHRLYRLEPEQLRSIPGLGGQVRAGDEQATGSDGRLPPGATTAATTARRRQ